MATIFRPPVIVPIPKARLANIGFVFATALCLTNSGTKPFSQNDWPLTPRGKTPHSDLRTFINPTETQLIGKDVQFAGPGDWQTYDYPNPVLPKIVQITQRTWTLSLLQSTLVPAAVTVPFNQDDWAVPAQVKQSAITQRTFIFYYVTDESVPFVQTAWPNPLPLRSVIDLRTWQQTGLAGPPFSIVPPTPNNQDDWPNPRGKAFPLDLRTWLQSTDLQLLGKDAIYGAPGQVPSYDWPNPQGKPFPAVLRTSLDGQWLVLRGGDSVAPGEYFLVWAQDRWFVVTV